jgi:hypothetical protein
VTEDDKKKKSKVKNCIFVMNDAQIVKMYTSGKIPTYVRTVVNFRPQKSDPNRVRIKAEGNFIKWSGEYHTIKHHHHHNSLDERYQHGWSKICMPWCW